MSSGVVLVGRLVRVSDSGKHIQPNGGTGYGPQIANHPSHPVPDIRFLVPIFCKFWRLGASDNKRDDQGHRDGS
jgi:hypothetical protein